MVKKIALWLGATMGAMVGSAFAANAVVWPGEGTMAPADWFDYKSGTGSSISYSVADDVQIGAITVKAGTAESSAGFGFNWKEKGAETSLGGYAGVCLNYKATAPFRVDFKQSSITDYNYWGAELTATSVFKKQFISFAELKQGWKSKTATVNWSASEQTGMQFAYKNTHATSTVNSNTIEIKGIVLGDECETFAPELSDDYKNFQSVNLAEGENLTLDLSDIFVDPDGDELSYVVSITGDVQPADTNYKKTGILHLKANKNPKADGTVSITATDPTNKSVKFTFTVLVEDVENAPVAVGDTFNVMEDSELSVSMMTKGLLSNDDDYDKDAFKIENHTEPAHGTLELDEYGTFTYTPNANFFGVDTFSYQLIEVGYELSKPAGYVAKLSERSIVVINVQNENDPMTVKVVSSEILVGTTNRQLNDTIEVSEDFEEFEVKMDVSNLEIEDPDAVGGNLKFFSEANGVVNVAYKMFGNNYHVIDISALPDSNGTAKISLCATDEISDTACVYFYVRVLPVPDDPIAVADTFEVLQDTLNKIESKVGLLVNDKNPDGKTTLKAVLDGEASKGKVELKEDGSFTYEAPDIKGEVTFSYHIENSEGSVSKPVLVVLNVVYRNRAPQVVAGVADTVGKRLATLTEDFTTVKRYTKAEILTWFKDDTDDVSKLTFTVRTDDSLLAPSMVSGALQIKAVKDACGDAEVILIATDSQKASRELAIPASIACVNDKPVVVKHDTLYVKASGWNEVVDLSKYVKDPEGDELIYEVSAALKTTEENLKWTLEKNLLKLSPADSVELVEGTHFSFNVKVSDPEGFTTFKLVVTVGNPPTSIKPVIASPKSTWQNAITQNRGIVALVDMQGRVMWKAKLPVSEADVRNAAAQVQGRKILRVNKQTWTIK